MGLDSLQLDTLTFAVKQGVSFSVLSLLPGWGGLLCLFILVAMFSRATR